MKHPFRTRLVALLALASGLLALAQTPQLDTHSAGRPLERAEEGYVGSAACRTCHIRNHETWDASYHSKMTQVASAQAIVAPFEGKTPVLEGVAWKLDQRELEDGTTAFFATPTRPDGQALTPAQRVVLTTGSHHYQVYWLADTNGTGMAQLPLVWHIGERRWVPRKSMFLTPHQPFTGVETGRWRKTCIKCHSTNGTHSPPDGGPTRVVEFGISCEACHGPGAEHVALHESDGAFEGGVDTTIVQPERLDHVRAAQVCGQCHAVQPNATPAARSEWKSHGFAFRPGADLSETRTLLRGRYADNDRTMQAFLQRNPHVLAELFWTDGEVRVSGREYNGLIESPCFQRGELTCITCHDMHPARSPTGGLEAWADDQLYPSAEGPTACLECHADYAEDEALRAHTRHAADSTGSDCLNCHMPYTTYGLTKAIRSHRISSPSVAASVQTGRPNACNQCHLDKSLGWAADRLRDAYGHERPPLDGNQEQVAAAVLWALQGDAGQRALMAWSLGWEPARAVSGSGWMPYLLSTLLLDSYDAVRWIAMQTVRKHAGHADFTLDFHEHLEVQRNHVRDTVLTDWLRDGLQATPEQRAAVLVLPDGKLDEPRYRAIYSRRDEREVRLSE